MLESIERIREKVKRNKNRYLVTPVVEKYNEVSNSYH